MSYPSLSFTVAYEALDVHTDAPGWLGWEDLEKTGFPDKGFLLKQMSLPDPTGNTVRVWTVKMLLGALKRIEEMEGVFSDLVRQDRILPEGTKAGAAPAPLPTKGPSPSKLVDELSTQLQQAGERQRIAEEKTRLAERELQGLKDKAAGLQGTLDTLQRILGSKTLQDIVPDVEDLITHPHVTQDPGILKQLAATKDELELEKEAHRATKLALDGACAAVVQSTPKSQDDLNLRVELLENEITYTATRASAYYSLAKRTEALRRSPQLVMDAGHVLDRLSVLITESCPQFLPVFDHHPHEVEEKELRVHGAINALLEATVGKKVKTPDMALPALRAPKTAPTVEAAPTGGTLFETSLLGLMHRLKRGGSAANYPKPVTVRVVPDDPSNTADFFLDGLDCTVIQGPLRMDGRKGKASFIPSIHAPKVTRDAVVVLVGWRGVTGPADITPDA